MARIWNGAAVKTDRRTVRAVGSLGVLVLLLLLTAWARSWNAPDVFVAGRTFFVDPDCYSRMTRVQQIIQHPGTIIHRHSFENWPEGTQPHTTAPFDYLTAALAAVLRPFTPTALDLAGALISPLLGLAAAVFLWVWAAGSSCPSAHR